MWHEGKRKTVSGGTHATRDEAEAAGWELALRYIDDPVKRARALSTVTLEQWVEQWFRIIPDEVTQSTADTYRWRMQKWILPDLGQKKLVKLDLNIIQRWLDEMTLSLGSKKACLSTLSSCLSAAAVRGMCDNPCKGLLNKESKAKKRIRKRKKMRVWSEEDSLKLILTGHPFAILGLFGGMRRGEILGLKWENVNWMDNTVTVCDNVVQTAYQVLYDESPKSGESREVELPPAAMTALALYKEEQEALNGTQVKVLPINPSQAQNVFTQLCKQAAVPNLGPHSMRHTCASMLFAYGASLVEVADHLGHENPTTTLSAYAHLIPKAKRRSAELLGGALRLPQVSESVHSLERGERAESP